MAREIDILRQRLANLQDQVFSGVSSVSVGGEVTQFVKPNEAQRLIAELEGKIAALTSSTRSRPRSSSISLGNT